MTDFTPPPLPSASFQAPSASAPVQPKKSKKALWVVLICLLGIVIVGLIVFGAFKLVDSRTANIGDQPAINNTLVGFMQGMSAKNVNKAYSYLSDRGKPLWPKEKLQKLLDGNDYRLFEKF